MPATVCICCCRRRSASSVCREMKYSGTTPHISHSVTRKSDLSTLALFCLGAERLRLSDGMSKTFRSDREAKQTPIWPKSDSGQISLRYSGYHQHLYLQSKQMGLGPEGQLIRQGFTREESGGGQEWSRGQRLSVLLRGGCRGPVPRAPPHPRKSLPKVDGAFALARDHTNTFGSRLGTPCQQRHVRQTDCGGHGLL
jgi:hypothetical protein